MIEKYKPVSCNLYDELANAILLHTSISITTIDNEEITGYIKDIYTKDKEEFCVINDILLRLDNIGILRFKDKDLLLRESYWSCFRNT